MIDEKEVMAYVRMPACFMQGCSEDIVIFRADGGNHFTDYGIYEGMFLFFDLELSSQVQQRIEENLKRGLPAEAFARSTVEFGNEGCYLSLAEVLHINRLGTVFTD